MADSSAAALPSDQKRAAVLVMATAGGGVNVPGAGGDGNNPAPAAPDCQSQTSNTRRPRRGLEPPLVLAVGSSAAAAAGSSWERQVRRRRRPAEAISPASSSSSSSPTPPGVSVGKNQEELAPPPPLPPVEPQLLAPAAGQEWPVAFGALSLAGRMTNMEDTVSLRPGFHTWVDGSPMHFFGVFDGHGGFHPNRPDELARIEALGGRVVCDDVPRVRGILPRSRTLGDGVLRPEVIAEPEITVTERTADDHCVILASDGMWDVMSNNTACYLARYCLEDSSPPPPVDPAGAVGLEAELRCSRAARVLARLAFIRDTRDSVSIIVIDLKQRD